VIPGETINETILWGTAFGGPARGRTTTDLKLSGWSEGAAVTLTPTLTELADSLDGRWRAYKLSYALPSTVGLFKRQLGSRNLFDVFSDPIAYPELESYDNDALAGLLLTSTGVPATASAADGDLGDVVENDSFMSAVTTIPLGKISPFGYSDLTGMTISAGIKTVPTDTAIVTTTSPAFFANIVSAASRTVQFGWITYPAGIIALASGEYTKVAYMDVQLKHTASGRIITGLRYTFTVNWQRDTTT
jgi:hypothetical protein